MDNLLKDVINHIENDLKTVGFRKTKGVYVCVLSNGVCGWLGLNVATHRSDKRIGLNPVVGVRHQFIEDRLGELLGGKDLKLTPTLSTSLGYVMPEGRYLEWLFEPPPFDYRSECKRVVQAIETYGGPFMKANATLEVILQDLEELRFASKETAVYRCPIARLMAGRLEDAVDYVKREVAIVGERVDMAAQEYRIFASNFIRDSQIAGVG
jgi:hypothetical protein